MTDQPIGVAPIETSATPAPVEQKSTETVIEQPKSRHDQRLAEMASTVGPVVEAKPAEPVKTEPTAEDKANLAARQALQDRMRAEDAERRLKEMTPKAEVPDSEPDINDQKTWGKKYQDKPNDLDTYKAALRDFYKADGRKETLAEIEADKTTKALEKQRVDIASRDNAARSKFKDYDAVINPIVPILSSSPILRDFVTKNSMGSEVAYELGRNPAVLQALLSNPDVWSVGEQLISMAARLKAPKPVEITKAPEPITPVGSRETVKVNLTQLASKDTGAYIAEANKRELARMRRH